MLFSFQIFNITFFNISIPVIIYILFKWSVRKNIEFHKLISDIEQQFPTKKNETKLYNNNSLGLTEIKIDEVNFDINEKDLNHFIKKLELFDYDKIFFKKSKIHSFSNNIQRVYNTTPNLEFKLSIIEQQLKSRNEQNLYVLGKCLYKYLGF